MGVEHVRARTCKQAGWILERFVAQLPHHMIFCEDDYGGNSYSAYFVNDVAYHPENRDYGGGIKTPEHCSVSLIHIENETRHATHMSIFREDCYNRTAKEILREGMDRSFVAETPELMRRLKSETETYYEVIQKVGKQYRAIGFGLCNLDDALDDDDRHKWDWMRGKIQIDRFGTSALVVVDIDQEKEDKHKKDRNCEVNLYRWHSWNMRFFSPSEDEVVRRLEADENTAEAPDIQIPVHPLVPVFDLRRHKRMRVHVNNLTEYVYRRDVANNLVLPERDWKMVNLLVDHSHNSFQDVVDGKGRSMNILSEGPPGTGKTVTAEVFSEFKERPLYSVQCSQLGIDPDNVEKNLSVILSRANRWNAVLLLDEADTYIRRRGDDISHNAIVGAFLRMLEYSSCILFMTTNLPDDVDDAIASRCIVRLRYGMPSTSDQARIWRILANVNGLTISDKDIREIGKRHPCLSGRDVKNLLKLASFVAAGKPITVETIEFALQFKPTSGGHDATDR